MLTTGPVKKLSAMPRHWALSTESAFAKDDIKLVNDESLQTQQKIPLGYGV